MVYKKIIVFIVLASDKLKISPIKIHLLVWWGFILLIGYWSINILSVCLTKIGMPIEIANLTGYALAFVICSYINKELLHALKELVEK